MSEVYFSQFWTLKSEAIVGFWGEFSSNVETAVFFLHPHMVESREWKQSLSELIRKLIPFPRALPSCPHLILITSQRPIS